MSRSRVVTIVSKRLNILRRKPRIPKNGKGRSGEGKKEMGGEVREEREQKYRATTPLKICIIHIIMLLIVVMIESRYEYDVHEYVSGLIPVIWKKAEKGVCPILVTWH